MTKQRLEAAEEIFLSSYTNPLTSYTLSDDRAAALVDMVVSEAAFAAGHNSSKRGYGFFMLEEAREAMRLLEKLPWTGPKTDAYGKHVAGLPRTKGRLWHYLIAGTHYAHGDELRQFSHFLFRFEMNILTEEERASLRTAMKDGFSIYGDGGGSTGKMLCKILKDLPADPSSIVLKGILHAIARHAYNSDIIELLHFSRKAGSRAGDTPSVLLTNEDQKKWYEVLGVAPDADSETINAAYRKKMKEVHPDTHPHMQGNAEASRRLTEARDEGLRGCTNDQ